MAWCPKCKSEYVEGIKVCADCGCNLVDSLTEDEESREEIPEAFYGMLKEEAKQTEDTDLEREPAHKYVSVYVNNEERAEENKSSAYTLLGVGTAGLVFIILFFFGIIDIGVSSTNKYMISGVMGVLFILFIVMGIVSMKNSRILRKKAGTENNLTMEIRKWCLGNFEKEKVDSLLFVEEMQEELKYFQRFDYIKKAIQKQFVNLDERYLDRLVEEIYPEIFEKDL